MVRRASAILLLASASAARAAGPPIDPAKISHGYLFAAGQLTTTAASITTSQFPSVTAASGQWVLRGASDWRSGFFPGQLWRMYEASGAPAWRDKAVQWTDPLATASITQDHDIGFVTMTSWGQALRLGPTRAYRDAARSNILANAQILAGRFKPAMGLIDSWNNLEEPNGVCIDNMMNVELLFAAHAQGGPQNLRDVAVTHAQTTMQQFVRPDGGTYHVVRHEEDGSIERKSTRQGYGDETTWSRGQAWAIHGYTTSYDYTRDATFLATSRQLADYFIANLPHNLNAATSPANVQAGDWVPPSDFHAERGEPAGAWNDADNDGNPGETNSGNRPGTPAGSTPYVSDRLLALNSYTQRDSSAAAVAASGLFRLATLVPNDTPANLAARQTYFDTAASIVTSLLTHHDPNVQLNYLADGFSGSGGPLRSILARGSELWNGASIGTSYGDYYFLEALARYERAGLDFLPLSVGNQWTGGHGSWSDASRWTAGAAVSGVSQAAHFRALAAADTIVTMDAPRTVGGLTFSSVRKYSLVGAGPLRIEHAGEAQITVDASGAQGHQIAAPVELASDSSVVIAPGAMLRFSGSLSGAANRLTKLGDGRLELTGTQQWAAGSVIRIAAGEMAIQSNLGASSPVVQLLADGGEMTLLGGQSLAALAVNGRATVLAAAGGASSIITSLLTIGPDAKLDLTDNHLIVRAGSAGTWIGGGYSGLTGLSAAGRNGGAWDGDGIITSDTRAASGSDLVSIGVARIGAVRNIADTATAAFAGHTVLGTDVIAMVTWGGDANLDGRVNIDDYGQIDFNAPSSGSVFGWYNGDFNYDGKINIDDYGIIDFNVTAQSAPFSIASVATPGARAPLAGVAAIPEPATIFSGIGLVTAILSRRRRVCVVEFPVK